jgi:hypothetical protein
VRVAIVAISTNMISCAVNSYLYILQSPTFLVHGVCSYRECIWIPLKNTVPWTLNAILLSLRVNQISPTDSEKTA